MDAWKLEIRKTGQKYVSRPILIPPKPIASAIHAIFYKRPMTSVLIGYEQVKLNWR